jgi:hypothetical protein
VLSGRGLCDELATRPEESSSLWRVAVCSIETSSIRSHNISPLWLIDQRDLLAGGDLITSVYKIRHPASTLIWYSDCWFDKYKKKYKFQCTSYQPILVAEWWSFWYRLVYKVLVS